MAPSQFGQESQEYIAMRINLDSSVECKLISMNIKVCVMQHYISKNYLYK